MRYRIAVALLTPFVLNCSSADQLTRASDAEGGVAFAKQCGGIFIDPISPTTLTVPAITTGNTVDFFVGNSGAGPVSVTVSQSSTGNIHNVTFFGGSNPFDIESPGETLDVGYAFDTGAAGSLNQITVTATSGCGSAQETFRIIIE